jgi:hypothetical protein
VQTPSATWAGAVPERRTTTFLTTPNISRLVMLGATSIVVGILWDISWHRTVGRDTFWTPAHLAIQIGGLIGGLLAGWLVLRTTFAGSAQERAASVKLWGFHGPLGAWVTIWGCIAMLTSAPFDNWWHEAYGLDVKVISPPHAVLALGMWAVVGGCLLLVLRQQNNAAAESANGAEGRWLYIYGSGVLLALAAIFLIEMSWPNDHRGEQFLRWSSALYPFYLLGVARASKFRFGATLIALIYMLLNLAMTWILPLFPGEPKLGPIYNRVDHFVPLPFPLLLVVPAFGIDLLRWAIGHGRSWWRDLLLVVLSAAVFVALFAPTQWFFSEFLLSEQAHNWFFAADRHWGYNDPEVLSDRRVRFWGQPYGMRAVWLAFVGALVSSALGLWIGNWMARVRR